MTDPTIEVIERLMARLPGAYVRTEPGIVREPGGLPPALAEHLRGLWVAEDIYTIINAELTDNRLEQILGAGSLALDTTTIAIDRTHTTLLAMCISWLLEQLPHLRDLLDHLSDTSAINGYTAAAQAAVTALNDQAAVLAAAAANLSPATGAAATAAHAQAGQLLSLLTTLEATTLAYTRAMTLATTAAAITRIIIRDLIAQMAAEILRHYAPAITAALATGAALTPAVTARIRATITRFVPFIVTRTARFAHLLHDTATTLNQIPPEIDQLFGHLSVRVGPGAAPPEVTRFAMELSLARAGGDETAATAFAWKLHRRGIDFNDIDGLERLIGGELGVPGARLGSLDSEELLVVEAADEYLLLDRTDEVAYLVKTYPEVELAMDDLAAAATLMQRGLVVPEPRWVAVTGSGDVLVVRTYLPGAPMVDTVSAVPSPLSSPAHLAEREAVAQGMEAIGRDMARLHFGEAAPTGATQPFDPAELSPAIEQMTADLAWLERHGPAIGLSLDGVRPQMEALRDAALANPGHLTITHGEPDLGRFIVPDDPQAGVGILGARAEPGSPGEDLAKLANNVMAEARGTDGLADYAPWLRGRLLDAYEDEARRLGVTVSQDVRRFLEAQYALSAVQWSAQLTLREGMDSVRAEFLLDDLHYLQLILAETT